jgi:hypothetical protein
MKKYATISVSRELKEKPTEEKGTRDWSTFLLELLREVKELKTKTRVEELRQLLSDKDLEEIEKSSKVFRERFALR